MYRPDTSHNSSPIGAVANIGLRVPRHTWSPGDRWCLVRDGIGGRAPLWFRTGKCTTVDCVCTGSHPRGVFFFNGAATTETYTLSLHDAADIVASPPATRR